MVEVGWVEDIGELRKLDYAENTQSRFTIYEEKPPGSYVGQISLNYPDNHHIPYQRTTYSLMEKAEFFPFSIDMNTGKIYTKTKFDYETFCKSGSNLCVIKSFVFVESTNVSKIVPIELIIQDVNEYSPDFGIKEVEKSIVECSPIGSRVVLPLAVDLDGSSQYCINDYKLLADENFPFKLKITRSQSQISRIYLELFEPLNLNKFNKYFGYVIAQDGGNKTGKLKIKISIFDSTDEDSDQHAKITYKIYNELFYISEAGDIFTTSFLDHETHPDIELIVYAYDMSHDFLSDSVMVKIKVLDVNDNNPVFPYTKNYFHLSENMPDGTFVGNVVAFDVDSSCDILNYYIEPADVPFRIDSHNGFIYSTEILDSEKISKYQFKVVATDCGPNILSASTDVVIFIDDVEDNPTVLKIYGNGNNIIHESFIADICTDKTTIATAILEDKDLSQKLYATYTLSTDSPMFTINKHTGKIRIEKKLNKYNNSISKITIFAHDQGILFEKSFKVMIKINETCYNINCENETNKNFIKAYPHLYGCLGVIFCGIIVILIIYNKRRNTMKLLPKHKPHDNREIASEFSPFRWSNPSPLSYDFLKENSIIQDELNSNYSLVDNIKLISHDDSCKLCDLIRLNSNYVFINCHCNHESNSKR
ncbi:protocadherin gamma-A1-like [Octopus sinensis]|uniref:Protocadherin gamma-A1-like n=1 Tax=Octopus sinensis TaxID=2607531 RepID=A0A6P7U3Q3_9MOLL|nr:protocadherin gamma-A1-like [Octopus sinensis]